MPDWDPNLYLKFSGYRARPAVDLIAQIELQNPPRVIDLGCGTGNSTEQLHSRWPQAELTGLDNSPEMLSQARKNHPDWNWVQAGVERWNPDTPYDLIFSNAALHWIGDHGSLFPRLMNAVAAGGALAVQMPDSYHLPAHTVMLEVANDPAAPWVRALAGAAETISVRPTAFYYDALRKLAGRLNIWQTEYLQILDGPWAILDWVRSTGMRRYTERLPSDEQRKMFEQHCLKKFEQAYPGNDQGKSLFAYRRTFIIAYR